MGVFNSFWTVSIKFNGSIIDGRVPNGSIEAVALETNAVYSSGIKVVLEGSVEVVVGGGGSVECSIIGGQWWRDHWRMVEVEYGRGVASFKDICILLISLFRLFFVDLHYNFLFIYSFI